VRKRRTKAETSLRRQWRMSAWKVQKKGTWKRNHRGTSHRYAPHLLLCGSLWRNSVSEIKSEWIHLHSEKILGLVHCGFILMTSVPIIKGPKMVQEMFLAMVIFKLLLVCKFWRKISFNGLWLKSIKFKGYHFPSLWWQQMHFTFLKVYTTLEPSRKRNQYLFRWTILILSHHHMKLDL
jgi:hypothetical protein